MGRRHAAMFRSIAGCALVAVADVVHERAVRVSELNGGPRVYASLEDMLDREDLDAVSIVAPDSAHVALSMMALAREKHVLCEKPLAPNPAEARRLVEAARDAGVVNMVNFSYRSAPALQKARTLITEGEIGEVVHLEASYLQGWLSDKSPDWRLDEASLWRLSSRHGSTGAMGDVGGHILDFASYPVGDIKAVSCRLQSFDGLKGISSGDYLLDANDSAVLHVEYGNGALGVIHLTRWASGHPNSLRLRVFGTLGSIVIDLDQSNREISLFHGRNSRSGRWRKIVCPPTSNNYQRFIRSILTGVNEQPDFARGAEIQNVIRHCEESSRSGARLIINR